jgi:glyoxylase I family protein
VPRSYRLGWVPAGPTDLVATVNAKEGDWACTAPSKAHTLNLASLADPPGSHLDGFSQLMAGTQREENMMFRRLDHVEIVPSDFERSLAFYTEVLGFGLKERLTIGVHPLRDIVYLSLGDTVLELLDFEDPEQRAPEGPRVGYRMMALEVESMSEALAYLGEKGIQASRAPYAAGGGSLRAEIRDPDGLPIELRQW